jgi:hypothetical protein
MLRCGGRRELEQARHQDFKRHDLLKLRLQTISKSNERSSSDLTTIQKEF